MNGLSGSRLRATVDDDAFERPDRHREAREGDG
jgi:hypothetical protein